MLMTIIENVTPSFCCIEDFGEHILVLQLD